MEWQKINKEIVLLFNLQLSNIKTNNISIICKAKTIEIKKKKKKNNL